LQICGVNFLSMNFRVTPLWRLTIPLTIGIATAESTSFELPHTAATLLIFGSVAAFFVATFRFPYRWRIASGLAITLLMFLLGWIHARQYDESKFATHFSKKIPDLAAGTLVGTVYDAPGKGGKRVKVPLCVEGFLVGDSMVACTGHVLLFLANDSLSGQAIRYGDRLALDAEVVPTTHALNPHAFDYGRYLHFQNIHYQGFVQDSQVARLSSGHGWLLWRWAYDSRDRLLTTLQRHFTTRDEYAVASALLVGYTDELSEDIRTAYAETGSMHALAVSGTHVGMLYAGLMFFLQRLPWRGKRGQILQGLLAFVAIWAFAFVTGATASVLRATVMFSFFLLGKIISRSPSIWNVLAGSALLLLLFNPYFLFDAGFQLSYAAVGGMVFFYPMLHRVSPIWQSRLVREGWTILLVGVSAQIGTLPLSLYYFHQFPCYFWLAGWVVVLGGAVFLGGGFFLVLLDACCPWLADGLGVGLYWMVWGMNRLIFLIQQLPGSIIAGIWLTGLGVVVLYAVIVSVGQGIAQRSVRWLLVASGLLSTLLATAAWRHTQQAHQHRIVVYAIPKAQMIDFFEGHRRTTLTDLDPALRSRELFAAQPNRWAHGIDATVGLGRSPEAELTTAMLWHHPPVSQFAGWKIAHVDHADHVQSAQTRTPVHFLILSHNARVRVAECLEKYPTNIVVLDGTNGRRATERWQTECAELGIRCHAVMTDGAFEWPEF
jgi:competence protein ComEC